jgi:hypothetical protein
MKRRNFLLAALASLLGLLVSGLARPAAPVQPPRHFHTIYRLENGRRVRVRMRQLRKGDVFVLEGEDGAYEAVVDAYFVPEKADWGITALYRPNGFSRLACVKET